MSRFYRVKSGREAKEAMIKMGVPKEAVNKLSAREAKDSYTRRQMVHHYYNNGGGI